MTMQEWREVAQMMNLLYDDGRLMFESDDKAKLMAWYSCLSDLEYEGVAKAVRNLVMKSPYKPKVADIRKEYVAITTTDVMLEQEAWQYVKLALRNSTYGSEEEFAALPQIVQDAVVSPDALKEWSQLDSEEVNTVIQSLFKRQFRGVAEQRANSRVIGTLGTKNGELAALAASTAGKLEQK